ncbi:hypothetical protein L1887_33668 [Cichorium endivia]|nr:hypothetical protein L1887_33668 [Cichorium endivia]
MAIGCNFDHRIVDGYSANMFISSWADIARSGTPTIFPSLGRSYLNPRSPTVSSSSIDNVFAPFIPPSKTENDQNDNDGEKLLVNRVYYIEGEQLKQLQLLATENGCRRSKLEAFTSFLWKKLALSMEDSGKHNQVCNMVVTVDGRRRLSEGDGEEKEKLLASHFGNVLSMPYGTKRAQCLSLWKETIGGRSRCSATIGGGEKKEKYGESAKASMSSRQASSKQQEVK